MPETTDAVPIPSEALSRVPVREWMVEVLTGPDKGKKFSTLEGLVRVGADPGNDLVLTDTTVSRKHLEIERTSKGLVLRDLGSRNGTYLETRRIIQTFVQPGDKILLGKTKLLVKQKSKDTEIELIEGEQFGELVGTSEAMRIIFAELRRTSLEDVTVLIDGETGTGKELAARAIHAHSSRRFAPFRVLDCAMMSEAVAEQELFGPEGAFASAEGGTLFFDEVAEIPVAVQPKLLRVLDTKELPGKGGKVNVRVIASTSKNLQDDAEQGTFRKDLYFRLAVARVRMPPLRTRKSDIPVLAHTLIKGLSSRFEISSQMLSLLEGYDWPGNVRELRNVLERGALMQSTGNTSWLDLLVSTSEKKGKKTTTSLIDAVAALPYHEAKDRMVGDFERQYFAEVMRLANYDIALAEQRTGLSMQSLYRLLKKNGLRLKDLKNAEGLS